jgi:hypothetical protein
MSWSAGVDEAEHGPSWSAAARERASATACTAGTEMQ